MRDFTHPTNQTPKEVWLQSTIWEVFLSIDLSMSGRECLRNNHILTVMAVLEKLTRVVNFAGFCVRVLCSISKVPSVVHKNCP